MKKNLILAGMLLVLGALSPFSALAFDIQKCLVTGKTEINKCVYDPGEEMVFLISVDTKGQSIQKGEYTLKWTRTGDDGRTQSGSFDLAAKQPFTVKTSLNKPGFVRILAKISDKNGKEFGTPQLTFDGGAGVDIEKIKPAAQEPADFDAFWNKQKARLAKVPVKAERKQLTTTNGVHVYTVRVDCAGARPVTGFLTIPANAAAKSLPVKVNYQGYSGAGKGVPPANPPKDQIFFDVNAHGCELGQPDEYYKEFNANIRSNGHSYAFDPKQNSNPETAYFNGMALRVMRSLEYVKTLPEWNGKDLIVTGGSQGGLQTVWAAALDSDVSEAHPFIVWCCDLAGASKQNRLAGWRPRYVPALDYYDPVFHARRIQCYTSIHWAGLGDYICPPSGLSAFYYQLKCKKQIIWIQGSTHGYIPPSTQHHPFSN